MLLELKRFSIPPGQRILLHDVSWQELELILDELGEHRAARIAYDNGNLEIMTPLPEHEDDKEITSDLVKALLEELEVEFRCLGSTTFKNASMSQGIEPDQCFYIENESRIRGKKRLDLSVDPPPDLALEIDLTSRTHPSIYEKLKVPELWRFDQGTLQINILRGDQYVIVSESQIFPGLNLMEAIPQHLKQSKTEGRNTTLKAFRKWLRAQNISACSKK
jgi:Uma2 family endonuclease